MGDPCNLAFSLHLVVKKAAEPARGIDAEHMSPTCENERVF